MGIIRYLATSVSVVLFATLLFYHTTIVEKIKSALPEYEIETVSLKAETQNTPPAPSNLADELDNKKIDSLLAQQAPSIKRCHQNRIIEVGPIKGLVLMGVTIMPTGSVANVSLLKSNLNDPLLVQCLVSVLERVKFPKYNGGPKQRAFPIEFQ